jgi:hypothetical protein
MAKPGKQTLYALVGETKTHTLTTVDSDGTAVNCSAMTLEFVLESLDRTDVTTVANANITKTSTTVSVAIGESFNKLEHSYRWALRRTDNGNVIMYGPYVIEHAPHQDAA